MKTDLQKYNYAGTEPKPVFNLTWYQGEDVYSEGSVEDDIIELIATNNEKDYSRIIKENPGWSTLYHLAHVRQNIVNWYPFREDSDILEIGCGMGAITEVLCDKCKTVTAVELSKRRATATLLRCREKENLEIIVGNLNDIKFHKKYDYITLIGVLEYQKTYTDSRTPYVDFLKKVKSLLKPEGKLLIAIENKYGVKYWCGAREDHSSLPFDGMNQYRLLKGTAQTFSREELRKILIQSGFKNSYFYYPLPDYKLPTVIYSEKFLPVSETLENMVPYYGAQAGSTLVANEMEIYKDIIENNVFEFFANSFLVECSAAGEMLGEVGFVLGGTIRQPAYRVMTTFRDKKVVKEAVADSNNHIREIFTNLMQLKKRGLHIVECEWKGNKIVSPYQSLSLLTEKLLASYEKKDIQGIFQIWNGVLEEIKTSSDSETGTSILEDLGLVERFQLQEGDKLLKKGYVDMIYRNCFIGETGEFVWFDQEWSLEKVPASYILFCNIWELYLSYPWMDEILTMDTFLAHYQILHNKSAYIRLRMLFQKSICDNDYMEVYSQFAGVSRDKIITNINALLGKKE